MTSLIPSETIEKRILLIRDQKVMLDADLAELYGVETRVLIQALKRNLDRFPDDFMFQLTDEEFGLLRSQSVISRWGGRRYAPYVFTEQGVAMLSSVLNSDRAIKVNIEIIRTFVKLREIAVSHKKLAAKLNELEAKYDEQFKVVFDALNVLIDPPETQKRRIGFVVGD